MDTSENEPRVYSGVIVNNYLKYFKCKNDDDLFYVIKQINNKYSDEFYEQDLHRTQAEDTYIKTRFKNDYSDLVNKCKCNDVLISQKHGLLIRRSNRNDDDNKLLARTTFRFGFVIISSVCFLFGKTKGIGEGMGESNSWGKRRRLTMAQNTQ